MGNQFYAGAGIGRIYLPQEYFETVQPDGTIRYEDGFNGTVHTFTRKNGTIVDDPCIRILLIEDGLRAAVVSMEIAQAPADQVQYTKQIVSEICKLPEEQIWVHSTHQFGFMHRPGNEKRAAIYDTAMKNAVREAAEAAANSFRPARLGVGIGESHVSANKNILPPEGVEGGPYFGPGSRLETDDEMTVIRFEDLQGKLIAWFLSYCAKPSVLCVTGQNVGNRQLNSEMTGVACKLVEDETGAPCIFCMPAAGDQYPRRTAQYFGFDNDGNWKKLDIGFERGIEIVDTLGIEMGKDALKICNAVYADTENASVHFGATAYTWPNKSGDGEIEVYADALTFGDIALIGFRQEMDCLTGKQIKAASPYRYTLPVSFMNGDGKYFGHLEAYEFNNGTGTWETARSPFAKGAAEEFVTVATTLLQNVKDGKATLKKKASECVSSSAAGSLKDFADRKWFVLEDRGDSLLLMSRDIQFTSAFDSAGEADWSKSSLRKYLNSEWAEEVFTGPYGWRIIPMQNRTASNPKYGIRGCDLTEDRVFLLSLEEAEKYLGGKPELLKATDADGKPGWWYLRSSGEAIDVPAAITAGGLIDYHGIGKAVETEGGVRPVIRIRKE